MRTAFILLCVLLGLIKPSVQGDPSRYTTTRRPNACADWVDYPKPGLPAVVERVRARRVRLASWSGLGHAAIEFEVRAMPDNKIYPYTVELIGYPGVQKRWGRYLAGTPLYDWKPLGISLSTVESKLNASREYNLATYNCFAYVNEVYNRF